MERIGPPPDDSIVLLLDASDAHGAQVAKGSDVVGEDLEHGVVTRRPVARVSWVIGEPEEGHCSAGPSVDDLHHQS